MEKIMQQNNHPRCSKVDAHNIVFPNHHLDKIIEEGYSLPFSSKFAYLI